MDRHDVKLAIFSESASGQQLARGVGIEPDDCWNRGDIASGGRPYKWSGVRFRSGLPDETPASEQISALLARLAPSVVRIAELAAQPGTDVTLSVGYFINEPQWQEHEDGALVRGLGVALNAAQIELLHAMCAELDIDIYVNTENG